MKLIALDVDETLLRTDHTISNYTLDILKKCKEKGAKIVLNTVRGFESAMKIAKQINADYLNLERGNLIVDINGNILYKRPFDKNTQKEFINYFNKFTQGVYVGNEIKFYGKVLNRAFADRWGIIDDDAINHLGDNIYKASILVENEKDIPMYNAFCDKYNLTYYYMRTSPYLIISPPNSDKWVGLDKLVKLLNANNKDLYVFGDDTTDLLSLKNAGHGIAVANSKREVLKEIKTTCPSNDDDGVARFLEENLL